MAVMSASAGLKVLLALSSLFLSTAAVALEHELMPETLAQEESALVTDDVCHAAGDEKCSLSLRQLRRQSRLHDNEEDFKGGEDKIARDRVGNQTGLGSPYGHPSDSQYPQHEGFTLWLVEDFDQPLDLDTDPIWTWSDGGLSEGQVRFLKEQIRFEDGKMKIVVDRNRGDVHTRSCSHAEKGTVDNKPLLSGEMRTRNNLFRYGRYEVRMKAPSVQPGNPQVDGNYISTMFVYRDGKFEHWREIDFEVTGDHAGAVTSNMLRADHTSRWQPTIQRSRHDDIKGLNVRMDFHTYAFEWLPNQITWYIDGKKVREQRQDGLKIPELSGKIMMNLWIFNSQASFGGSRIENNRYPMHSEYDWFRFYKWDGDASYPCAGMDDKCLTHEDQYLSANNPCDGKAQIGTVNGRPPCHATC